MAHTQSEDPRVSRHVRLVPANQVQMASLQLHWRSSSGTPTQGRTRRVASPLPYHQGGVNPGGALNLRNRQHQTTLTRFRTGHLKPLKIENNNKIYPTCPKCSLVPAAPEHILACIRCTKQDIWGRPLLIIKQLEEHELMEFVFIPYKTFEWFSRFLKGREKVNDDQHAGRPRSLRCNENKLKIKELIKSNRRISIKDLSSETGLSVGLCH
ncbi:GVQW3 [Cordylochernes scorpioides]|uniref:GVQW3 n=1 Tax=Cordylochernes scorpioides TaxID=51811 RepID=A0ABY6LIB8_9ARAC|nr:GVQW3 [Cordylochernes scorpioides]